MDTLKTDFNLNNIIATMPLISISSVKKFAGKCPQTYSNLISTPQDESQSWWVSMLRPKRPWCRNLCALPLVRCKTIDLLFPTSLESQESYLTTGMFPYKHSRLFPQYARLYNAAASPASRLRSAGLVGLAGLVGNHGEGKPWCIQSERYPIRGGLAEK